MPPTARSGEVCVVAMPPEAGPVTWRQYQHLLARRLERLIRRYPDVRSAEREVERGFWDRLGREFYHDRATTPFGLAVQVVTSADVEALLHQEINVRRDRFPVVPRPSLAATEVLATVDLYDWLVHLLP